MLSWKQWNVLVLKAFFSALILISFSAEFVLFRMNENLDIEHSIEKQIGESALYGRVLIGQDAIYKMQMAKRQRADILVIGSSRVMQFRQEFFYDDMSFFNAGGCMPSIEQGTEFLEDITMEYKPKMIILGIDLWWLNGAYNEEDHRKKEILSNNVIQNRLFLYGSLVDNVRNGNIRKLNVNILRDDFHNTVDPFEHHPAIGLLATLNGDGFRVDGSYQYGGVLTGKTNIDKNFEDTHKRIATGTARFEYTDGVDVKKLEQLKRFFSVVKAKGIPIVVFAPPFAHEIYEALDSSANHKAFLNDFRSSITQLCVAENVNFYDFSDVTWYGSDDDETIDGFHGSETSYAKLLLAMKQDTMIGKYIHDKRILEYISKGTPKYCIPIK